MTSSNRRIALLTGASIAALGMATPSFAAPHDILLPGGDTTNPGTNTTDNVINLCTVAAATPACFFGVIDTGVATANATVSNTATGRIYQHDIGATIVLDMNVVAGDTAEVGAIAVATGGANAVANAIFNTVAVEQSAVASGDAIANLNVDGRLLIDAVAIASGSTFASANADFNNSAIEQSATVTALGTGTAAVNIYNAGSLTVLASASAVASLGLASADATINTGIDQSVTNQGIGNASILIDNAGTLDISAIAFASGDTAIASASVSDVIDQVATAQSGDASVGIVNNALGLITLSASAVAIADDGNATADATNQSAIDMFASSTGIGNAAADLTNAGTMNIAAHAFANAFSNADASATVSSAIEVGAFASDGDASAGVLNSGPLNINANAVALGFTSAEADASIFQAISVSASADSGGAAVAAITNDALASIDIGAVASAVATGLADASASITSAIEQYAYASSGGNASVDLNNDGALAIHATAVAIGDDASASANNDDAIYQSATVVSGGTASVNLANGTAGTIDIGAVATATGSVEADAYAYVSQGIYQTATASVSGNAVATIANDGAIAIHATANASASLDASASAIVSSAVSQYAYADSGDATVGYGGLGTLDIDAVARAFSTTSDAWAYASVSYGVYQVAQVATAGNALATNNFNGLNINATATAFGSEATATAYIYDGIGVYVDNNGVGNATNNLTNSGDLVISAVADAESTRNFATAYATVSLGISQTASASDGNATVSLVNNGTIAILADANAVANTYAHAYASVNQGIGQFAQASNGGDAYAEIINAPAMSIVANATATGNSATATATVNPGITQTAQAFGGGDAGVLLDNADPLTIEANALANADVNDAYAFAYVTTGIYQNASATLGSAEAVVVNAGTLTVAANATANGATFASASAYVTQGIEQSATAGSGAALALVENSNSLSVQAAANAVASTAAIAFARVNTGIDQFASGTILLPAPGGPASLASIDNAGVIDIGAVANATAPLFASAIATAYGFSQEAVGGTASFFNDTAATFSAHATAFASATAGTASASANAYGGFQTGALNAFENQNLFNVLASAVATGTAGVAYANVIGMGAYNTYGVTTNSLDYLNAGTMNVSALAAAPSTASAYAVGISAFGNGPTALLAVNEQILAGSIINDGTLNVVASAAGMGTTVTLLGATVTHSVASATGILLGSGTNNMTVVNTGLLSVDAVTAGNGSTTATGVLVYDNGRGLAAAPGSLFTFTNDGGDIIVRESLDGGGTWRRGMAIDVAASPNPSVINLLGDGYVYGNVDITTGDNIFVEGGTTYFDGIVNPECLPAGGLVAADLDDPLISACGQGTLTIQADGNLVLADPRLTGDPTIYDGPAYVFVEEFNVAADGTITFELQPDAGGDQPVGTYPQVFADVANLDGTLVADVTPAGGLFADNYFWDNVIDANVRNGGFDGAQCVLDGAYAGSLLLDLDCIEDANDNIDLSLDRIAFNAVPGLNNNGIAVGEGLECIYDTSLTGGIADLLGDLFLFTDPVNYNIALNQLAGSSYANYLQSFPSLGVHYNDLLAKATDCEIPALAGSVLECRASAPIHVWGQLDYQWRKADGDSEAGTMKAKRFTGLLGIDTSVGNSAIVGISAGAVSNKTHDRQFGDDIDATGMQVGAYGVYDPGQFYVKAMTTYSWYDGDSDRNVSFVGLAPGATFAASLSGDPDVKMWTFGLHGGYRMGLGGNSVLTPYLNYDYVNAKMDEFIEGGTSGAALHLDKNSAKHSFLTGGVKWATQLGGVVPEVNLGYRYRFGDKRTDITQAFLCQTDTCPFDVVSAGQKRGNFLAGLSVGGKFGPVDLRIGYEGEFNSDVTSHSGNFKFVLPLGSRAAPPPPPPPAPYVAPPPPVEVAPPPPPPPPPPAPVERGERGQ